MAWRNVDGDVIVSGSKSSRSVRESTDIVHVMYGSKHDTGTPFGMYCKPGDATLIDHEVWRDFANFPTTQVGVTEVDLVGGGGSADWFIIIYGNAVVGPTAIFSYDVCQGNDSDDTSMHCSVGYFVTNLTRPGYYRFGPDDDHEVQSTQLHVFGDDV